ncbi:MAG: S41 family peptidase [Candidatus Wildermuthbacteria bacterium]|nr:S41 family peptidase [Candidatus Wildermuthbacteria bacterium]
MFLKALRKIIFVFVVIVLLSTVFAGGFLVGKLNTKPEIIFGVQNPELGQPSGADFSLFWEIWADLGKKFVNSDKMNPQKMIYGAISGMVKSLDDPYTIFFPPKEAKRFEEDVKGSFEGVGMEIDKKKDQITVVSPLEGTPAQGAGLRAGDKILAINGTSTADMTTDEAVGMIRGPKGTEVTLTIARNAWPKPKEIKLVRDVIQVPSLKLEFKDYEDQKIVYLKLYQFSERASSDFSKAAVEILNSPAKKIILDLRNNPGGYLEVAQDIAGWFLERGETVAIEDFGGKKEQSIYKAQGSALLSGYPMVALINQGSASASEILAGSLRDNRGIVLIGEKSFGKGSVQELEKFREGSSLKVTVAKWLTPKGKGIGEVGLEPDTKVEITDKDIEAEKDPQLDKALEIIREIR